MKKTGNLRADAIAIWQAGVDAVHASKLVRDVVSLQGESLMIGDREFPLADLNRIVVVGFGKASGAMAAGIEQALRASPYATSILEGHVNVPDDLIVETPSIRVVGCRPAGENLPTRRVIAETEEILKLVRSAGPHDICICLISGGGSALLESPTVPITLDDLRLATMFLSSAGASIYELNAVRRAISNVKGGGLALASGGAPVIGLIVSDVVGDSLDVIASGPTVLPTGEMHANDVLIRFDPHRDRLPSSIWSAVESYGDSPQTTMDHADVTHFVIGNIETAMGAAKEKAIELGYRVAPMTVSGNEGDASDVGRSVAGQLDLMIEAGGRQCQITGGETTVAPGDHPGNGGRNQHLVLAAIINQREHRVPSDSQFCLLSGGTDGEDGSVPVAGAWVDSDLIARLSVPDGFQDRPWVSDHELNSALERFDSFSVLSELQCLLKVPPTSTNVCDLRILVAESPG